MKKVISLLLALLILLSGGMAALASAERPMPAAVIEDTGSYLYQTVKSPQVGSVGGEWAVIGLARRGGHVPDSYYADYYQAVETYVRACGGVLHEKKYTEYSRVILGLTAAGYDPRHVAGYDLTAPLGDFEKTVWQGINGPVWALIALDSADYPIQPNPAAKTQATRDLYIAEILRRQLPDGGFSLLGRSEDAAADSTADPDITAMVLQALAKYQDRTDVQKATEEALACLSQLQNRQGGYTSWGVANSESVAQAIVALTELRIPLDDSRFVKDGNTLVDSLLTFYKKGEGFLHTADGSGANQMATEQALCALVAAQRAAEGKNSLYRMADAVKRGAFTPNDTLEKRQEPGLPGKNAAVKPMPVMSPGKTFDDIQGHKNRTAIEALAARGIIGGKSDRSFDPDAVMTRAELATIITRSLGLSPKPVSVFADVPKDAWYAEYVGAAYAYGIVNGTSAATFNPGGTITREEAAVMAARAAKLCGMDTALTDGAAGDMLAQFTDCVAVSDWARSSLAFCYQEDLLSPTDLDIRPTAAGKRGEIAQMLFQMLGAAHLL